MKPFKGTAFNVTDVLGLASRYRGMMVLGTLLSLALFMAAAEVIPKKYKSSFVLTIYAKYFQSPLTRDLLSEVTDAGEMKSQREALIHQALGPEFLDSLDRKYGIYHPVPGPQTMPSFVSKTLARLKAVGAEWGVFHAQPPETGNSAAQQDLLARIQIFNFNNMTFQVSFIDSDASVSFQVTQDIYAQVIRSLLETRTRNLVTLRNAIRKRLESLSFNMASAPDPRASLRPRLLREELADVRGQLRALGAQYTEEHPLIAELREREKVLVRWLDSAPQGGPGPASERGGDAFLGDKSGVSAQEMYNDLTKKLDYLNIALESDKTQQEDYFSLQIPPIYPKAPLWPKKSLFALWGFAGGLIGTLFLAALRDYFDRSTLHADGLAGRLGIPLLGGLPVFPGRRLSG
jgi:hypothetical protein